MMRIVFLVLLVLFVGGCVSPYQESAGTYIKTAHTEFRSPFGTNDSFSKLQRCEGPDRKVLFYLEDDFKNCVDLTLEEKLAWDHGYSQGQGGQIVSGAMNAGAVGAIAASHAGGNAAATVTNTIVTPRPYGRR